MNTVPEENLELRAIEQRHQLHQIAEELKTRIGASRENLSIARQARQHFVPAAVIACVVGLLAGYTVTGFFTGK